MGHVLFINDDIVRSTAIDRRLANKTIVFTEDDRAYWSTGKLEKAIADGHTVLVATTLTKWRPCDAWWLELVGNENAFLAKPEELGDIKPGSPESFVLRMRCQSAGFMAAFERLGIPWPEYGPGRPRLWLYALDVLPRYRVLTARDIAV